MSGRVTVLVEHGDGRLTRWTADYEDAYLTESDNTLHVTATGWHRARLIDPRPVVDPEPEPLNLPVLDHHHEIDAGGNCRDTACGFNSDSAVWF